MKLYRLFIICMLGFVLSFSVMAEEDKNPFMEMVEQPYAEYAVELRTLYWEIDKGDSILSRKRLEQIREVAHVTRRKEWEFEARLFEISYRFREEFRDSPLNPYHQEDALRDLLQISDEARETRTTFIYLRTLHNLMRFYHDLLGNYEMSFEYAHQLSNELEGISAHDFPDKLYAFNNIALMYYRFRDYEEAAGYLNKIIAEEEAALSFDLLQPAYNDMGLVYRNYTNDLYASDSCFRKVIEIRSITVDSTRYNRIWEAIAKGNLGYNHYLRGEFKEAIPLLEVSYRTMASMADYSHASGSSIALADIYLQLNDHAKCRQYIDISSDLINHSLRKDRWRQLYPIMSKYYTLTGNHREALAYVDSTVQAQEEYNRRYSALQLLRAEQRSYRMEQRVKEEELQTEKVRSRSYRTTTIIVSVGFLLVVALFIYTYILYRKRREAYRELVIRAREWATLYDKRTKDTSGHKLGEHLQHIMENEKPYLSPDLTLEELAGKLNTDRNSLSQFINQEMEKNFSLYINEYRIKEAIRLLDNPIGDSSIDDIAFESGFNNRVSFYRAFKKATGLSPSNYRMNK